MTAKTITKSLHSLIESQIPTFIWGAPGVGKSSIVKQIAQELDVEFIDLRLSLLDPTDLKGIPFFDKHTHRAVWASPSFLPHDEDTSGILFLDELNAAPPSVQASAYQLILDRKIGEYTLPKNWAIVAAGNRENDRGVTFRMPSPLANRFVHLDFDVDVEDWKNWAYKADIHSAVISFISFENSQLFMFQADAMQKSFATPRSWEYVSNILNSSAGEELLLDLISGAVGEESAIKFLSFKKVFSELPLIKDILDGNETFYPTSPQALHALISSIIANVKSDEELENVLKYALELKSEFSVLLVQDLGQNGANLERLKSWSLWVERFSYLL